MIRVDKNIRQEGGENHQEGEGGYGEETEGEEGGEREGDTTATATATGAGRPCGRDKGGHHRVGRAHTHKTH